MAASLIKELYNAPNGDRWTLCRNQAGNLVVCHQPNEASGGRASETAAELFLSFGGHGPEYQALRDALAGLGQSAQADGRKGELSAETTDRLSRALGEAVARSWSSLPQIFSRNYSRPQSWRTEKQFDKSLQSTCMGGMTERVTCDKHGRCRSRIAREGRSCGLAASFRQCRSLA